MTDRSHGVTPLAGTGWLWAGAVAVVFTPGDEDPRPSELGRLVSDCTSGWDLAARLLSAAGDGSLEGWPPFGVAATVPDGLVVVGCGVEAFVDFGGEPQPAAGHLVVASAGPDVVVRLGAGDWDPSYATGDLVEGIARAGGVAFLPRTLDQRQLREAGAKDRGVLNPPPRLPAGRPGPGAPVASGPPPRVEPVASAGGPAGGGGPAVAPAGGAGPAVAPAGGAGPAVAPAGGAGAGADGAGAGAGGVASGGTDATGVLPSTPTPRPAPTPTAGGEGRPASVPPPPPSVLGSAPEEPGPPSARLRSALGPGPVTVKGVSCGRGHFNDPAARFCRVCGLAMHQASRVETTGERPALGVLVWDHGGSDQIQTDLVIGREPESDPRVASGEAEGLVPAGEVASLSRIHAEIRLEGWEARLIDRDSSNGTFVWEAEQNRWRRLDAGEPLMLEAGLRLGFAERVAVYETGIPAF